MKGFKIIMLFLAGALINFKAAGQANASLNILSGSSGQVVVGGTVDIQITVGNTGPNPIPGFKVRAQISVPVALVNILPTAQQTGLPVNWTISSNVAGSGSITVCNSTDVIPAGAQRQIYIKIQGTAIGGPSTINGQLLFSNGTSCTIPGSLTGDNTADNNSTTSIQVIAAPSCTLTGVTASAGAIACNGGTTTLTATPAGVTGAVEYNLNNGPFQSSNTFTVGAGTYTVTAREVSTPACTASAPAVSITEPPGVTAPLIGAITQPTCTTATGSADLSGLPGGNWTINPGNISGNTTTTTISGLVQGAYNFTVTNAAGCTSTTPASVVINAQPSTPAAPVTGSVTQPTCAVSTGTVVLSGLPSGNWIINPGTISGSTVTITLNNLDPGIYNFTVTNADGCTSSASAAVIINDVPGAPSAPTVNITQPTCTIATGTITITSGITGFTFSLDGGAYGAYPAAGYIVTAGSHTLTTQNTDGCISAVTHAIVNSQPATPAAPAINVIQPTCTAATGTITVTSDTAGLTFSLDGGAYAGYPASGYSVTTGSHSFRAQSASGCISAVTNVTVNAQPIPPIASASAGTIACNGGSTTLTVTGTGGTGTLEYSLNGGAFQSGNTFTVGAGTYTVTVRDANLCTGIATVTMTQPPAIIASASTGAIACNGGTSTLIVAATGGASPLLYSLNGSAFQPGNTFIVGAGIYTVTVKDANHCTVTTPAETITQPANLIASANAKRITQCGGNAEVTITASGGIVPYTSGVGTFSKGPGTWIFSVTDSGGCTDTTQVTIEAPGCMNLKVFPNPAKNSVSVNHSTAGPGSFIQVFDIHGARVIYQPVPQNAFLTTIDVSKLAASSYVLVYWDGTDKKKILFIKISSN